MHYVVYAMRKISILFLPLKNRNTVVQKDITREINRVDFGTMQLHKYK